MTATTDNGTDSTPPAAAAAKIVVDMAQLSLADLGAIDRDVWERLDGVTLDAALQDYRQKPAMAIMLWHWQRRVDPSYTLEEAQRLRPAYDFDVVRADQPATDTDPEASRDDTGTAPPSSRVSGA